MEKKKLLKDLYDAEEKIVHIMNKGFYDEDALGEVSALLANLINYLEELKQ